MLALLIALTVWASYTVWEGPRESMPVAGPPPPQVLAGMLGGVNNQITGAGGGKAQGAGRGLHGAVNPGGGSSGGVPSRGALEGAADPALMNFLLANRGDAEYLVAGTSARSTAPIILGTDAPVISLGGYNGIDPVLTTKRLADLVNRGAVRFFLIPDRQRVTQTLPGNSISPQQPGWQGVPGGTPQGGTGGPPDPPQNGSARWVQDNCKQVPQRLWQSPTGQGDPSLKTRALYDCGAGRR